MFNFNFIISADTRYTILVGDLSLMKTFNDYTKYFNTITNNTIKCKCGHSITFMNKDKNKKICTWCGHYVYKSDKDKFKDVLNKLLRSKNENKIL